VRFQEGTLGLSGAIGHRVLHRPPLAGQHHGSGNRLDPGRPQRPPTAGYAAAKADDVLMQTDEERRAIDGDSDVTLPVAFESA